MRDQSGLHNRTKQIGLRPRTNKERESAIKSAYLFWPECGYKEEEEERVERVEGKVRGEIVHTIFPTAGRKKIPLVLLMLMQKLKFGTEIIYKKLGAPTSGMINEQISYLDAL